MAAETVEGMSYALILMGGILIIVDLSKRK